MELSDAAAGAPVNRRRAWRGAAESDCFNLRGCGSSFSRQGGQPDVLRRAHRRGAGGGAGLFRPCRGLANGVLGRRYRSAAAGAIIDALAAGIAGVSAQRTGRAATHAPCAGQRRRYSAPVVVLFLYAAGGLYVDQLAADAVSRPGIQPQRGGGGDVCPAVRRRLRDVAAGGADG